MAGPQHSAARGVGLRSQLRPAHVVPTRGGARNVRVSATELLFSSLYNEIQ
jgi:hypothetical protein